MNQVSISLEGDKVFVETFLISANDLNSKGWKVSHDDPEDFDNRVLASKNHPLTLYQTEYNGKKIWDHPHAPKLEGGESASNEIQNDIEFQKKYTIGYATHFKKIKDGIWNATYEIVNDAAKKFFTSIKDKGLQLFTSPYIAKLSNEDRTNLKTWALVHNAIVSNPANKRDLAAVKEICQGSESSCSALFASDNDNSQTEDCGYCMEQSLRDYVTSHSQKELPKQNIMSETASSQAQAQVTTVAAAAPLVENNNTSTPNQKESNVITINPTTAPQIVTENNKPNVDTKDSQINELKAQIESMNKQMALEKRTSSVKEILKDIAPVVYLDTNTGGIDEQRFNADLDGLVNRNLSIEDIQELAHARFIIAKSRSGASPKVAGLAASDNEFTSQVPSNVKNISYTKMITGESASNNNSNPSVDLENAVLSRVLSQNLAMNSRVLSNAKRFGSTGGFGY